MRTKVIGAVLWVVQIAGVPGTAVTQSTSISGRVFDGSGQPIPGVSVLTTEESGGSATRTTTGSEGTYQFGALTDGTYRVDFEVQGFDVIRRNHVRVRAGSTAVADAALPLSPLCECLNFLPETTLRERAGLVADQSGIPLAHARIQIVSPVRREVAYTDSEGRFRVRLPVNDSWPLTASDTGFGPVTQQVSAILDVPVVFKLTRSGMTNVPDIERLNGGCRCPGLFTHDGR
jgi:hypothetical protein